MKKEDECIGIGFWVEGFGTVDMYYYPAQDLQSMVLDPHKRRYINQKARNTMNRLYKIIENPELLERDGIDRTGRKKH